MLVIKLLEKWIALVSMLLIPQCAQCHFIILGRAWSETRVAAFHTVTWAGLSQHEVTEQESVGHSVAKS
jgi:hypothetical protein